MNLEDSLDKGDAIFNQHYTNYETIAAMYDALADSGLIFKKALEPSVGSGNFIGMMPGLEWTAVDIDKNNTEIVKRLYPEAKVSNESYETFKGKNYDLIISNVPFASFAALPRKHASTIKPAFKAIHNFFFSQSIDKLKDGGVMAFMTSTGTMDGVGEASRLRARLVEDMDVIGAYRLPMGSQKANASTEVMIDVIFLQKRPKGVESKQDDKNQSFVSTGQKDGHRINKYFIENPTSILGDLSVGANKTSMGRVGLIVTGEPRYSEMVIKPQEYKKQAAKDAEEQNTFPTITESIAYAKANGLKISNRTQPFYDNGVLYDEKITYTEQEGSGLFGKALTGAEQGKVSALTEIEQSLNASLITKYKEKYNTHPSNDRALQMWARKNHALPRVKELSALFGEDFTPSEIFTDEVRFVDSGKIEVDANSSLSERAESLEDADGIMVPSNSDVISKEEVQVLLDGGAYSRISPTKLQNSRLYYAGNIYKKLDAAKNVKPADQRDRQIAGLNKVLPERFGIKQISIKGNESWLPDMAATTLGERTNYDGAREFGTNVFEDSDLFSLYNKYLNGAPLAAKHKDDSTEEYAEKIKNAQRKLADDVLPMVKQYLIDSGQEEEVVEAYNRARNFFSPPVFDGSSLKNVPKTFRGKEFKLMQHQQEGAERAIYNKRGVLAFAPGLGKTPTAVIVTQQLIDKGVIKKPLFIVPANTIPQWQETVRELYPNAKIFEFPRFQKGVNKGKIKDWADMDAGDKEAMIHSLTNNRYDYTFISTNMAQKITVPTKKLNGYIDELIKEMSDMEEADSSKLTKSQLKARERRLAKNAMLRETVIAAYKDAAQAGFDMEKLGFDAIIADEVQYYKNIGMQSRDTKGGIGAPVAINEVWPKDAKGAPIKTGDPIAVKLGSARSYDFRFKTRYISEMNNGNNVFLLTGTPTPNKPMELMT
ncbi:MAG: hypothetical protein DRQ98_13330, partial [Gammaproteobacteria bacterium]